MGEAGPAPAGAPTPPTGTTAAAADAGRTVLATVESTAAPAARAAAVARAWGAVESTLQAVVPPESRGPPGPPRGQALVRALRQGNVVSLDEGHALLDLLAVAERAQQPDYQVTDVDVTDARQALARLRRAAPTGAGPALPVAAARGDLAAGATPMPAVADLPVPAGSSAPSPGRGRGVARVVGALLGLVLAGGAVAFWIVGRGGALDMGALTGSSAHARAIAAYDAGRRDDARAAFVAAARADSEDPVPHLYLGRIARESGDLTTARRELATAIRLAPDNAVAQREMGSALLTAGHADVARHFFVRAVTLDPADRTAQGYLACSLAQLGRADEAQHFLDRAGSGPWNDCARSHTGASPPTPAPAAVTP